MKAFLVAGGSVDREFLKERFYNSQYDIVVGIDGGARYLYDCDIKPDVLIGDFDTLDRGVLDFYKKSDIKILDFMPEKDATDTELALLYSMEAGCDEICVYGATGTRLDHVLANIQSLMQAFNNNVKAYIIDTHNRIHYLKKEEIIFKDKQYGKYVSLVPMSETVTGVTLQGFAYPLNNAVLTNNQSLAISNQIVEERAKVSYREGILLMIESKD